MALNYSTGVDVTNSTFSEVHHGGTQINGPQINYFNDTGTEQMLLSLSAHLTLRSLPFRNLLSTKGRWCCIQLFGAPSCAQVPAEHSRRC